MKVKKKGFSVQELIGIETFTDYGISTNYGELLFYTVAPTNISVLSKAGIEIKIRHLMMVLTAYPELEITCTDASECFDDNKLYLTGRKETDDNLPVKKLLGKDIEFLDKMQTEMATARQFIMIGRCRATKPEQVFKTANRLEKIISEQGFEVRRMKKTDIKRFLALYFDASFNGERIPDIDGEQYAEYMDIADIQQEEKSKSDDAKLFDENNPCASFTYTLLNQVDKRG